MNLNKNRLLLMYFIKTLQHSMQNNTSRTINPVFMHILNQEELQDIVKWLYGDKLSEKDNLNTKSKEALLGLVGDDFHILCFTVQKWHEALKEKVTYQKVYEVLYQLGLETHYLMIKEIEHWDEYDHSNFKSLSKKAGICEPLYAVFKAATCEEDKYSCAPLSKYYNSKWEAQVQLSYLLVKEHLEEHQLKIMIL
jgi:hypothetical protein